MTDRCTYMMKHETYSWLIVVRGWLYTYFYMSVHVHVNILINVPTLIHMLVLVCDCTRTKQVQVLYTIKLLKQWCLAEDRREEKGTRVSHLVCKNFAEHFEFPSAFYVKFFHKISLFHVNFLIFNLSFCYLDMKEKSSEGSVSPLSISWHLFQVASLPAPSSPWV